MQDRESFALERLDRFADCFRGEFQRREQAHWAAVYLRALLRPGGRKTIEELARSVTLPAELRVSDIPQALQHFINQSPWDERRLWRRYHRRLAERLNPDGVFILEELAFRKQGSRSVGVQRQFSAALGGKTNCQIAVALHHACATACVPLLLRLYLPRQWLEDLARLKSAGVPQAERRFADKQAIALELLDQVRAAGIPARAIAPGRAWGNTEGLARAVEERGFRWLPETPPELIDLLRHGRESLQNELGLDHFEGRSWRGFHHHACLVLLAYGFQSLQSDEWDQSSCL
jgi:SRSO17 transposase